MLALQRSAALQGRAACVHASVLRGQNISPPALRSSFLGSPWRSLTSAFSGLQVGSSQCSPVARRRSIIVEANSKRGKGETFHGTRRARTRTSGFRTRRLSANGRRVLRARRKKGRHVLCPAFNKSKNRGSI